MNVDDAAYRMVHDYPGGSEALATRMGMSAAVLRNKVNPNNTTHRLTLEEADLGMGLTGDFTILEALACQHGFILRPAEESTDAACVLQAVLESQAARGSVWAHVQQALADGRITPNEFAAIDSALSSAVVADRRLRDALRSQIPHAPEGQD